ncbi:MAG: hypothetical protein ACRDS0_06955 [Pseudonocardiaceae bacterium]
MGDILALLMVVALFGVAWAAWRGLRPGFVAAAGAAGYSLMGPFDEMWHPAALQARIEIQV